MFSTAQEEQRVAREYRGVQLVQLHAQGLGEGFGGRLAIELLDHALLRVGHGYDQLVLTGDDVRGLERGEGERGLEQCEQCGISQKSPLVVDAQVLGALTAQSVART